MIIEIPEATITNNKLIRMHHRAKTKEHRRYDWLVKAGLNGWSGEPKKHCVITVTRHASRLLDWDNMGGGLKFLLDGLVHNGVIEDDNPNCIINLRLRQKKAKRKEERTIIEVE